MKKFLRGGESIYPTQSSPNLFNPLPPEDMVKRKGEDFIWLRTLPDPSLPKGGLAIPKETTHKGYYVTYEKTRKIIGEVIQYQKKKPYLLETIYGNITKILNLYAFRVDFLGGNIPIEVLSFEGNEIRIKENPEVKPYYQILIDYEVETFETVIVNTSIKESGFRLTGNDLGIGDNYIVKVRELWESRDGKTFEQIESKHNYVDIILPKIAESGTKYKAVLDIVPPVSIAYKTIDLRDERLNEKSIDIQVGDLDAIMSPYYNVAKGDIFICTRTISTEKEVARIGKNGLFRLKYSPVVEILTIYSENLGELKPENYTLVDMNSVKLNVDPGSLPKSISVAYNYHPAYRAVNQVTTSGLNQKLQPKQFILRQDSTNIILT